MGHNNEKKIERIARLKEGMERWWQDEQDRAEAEPLIATYNEWLKAGRTPLFQPTIRAALLTKHHWLVVLCRSCGTVIDLDLGMKRRPPQATILMAFAEVKCPRCNGHGRMEITALRKAPGL